MLKFRGVFLILVALIMGPWLAACSSAETESATEPVPRKEAWWRDRHRDLKAVAARNESDIKLLFLGDSITEGMTGARDILNRLWGEYHPSNFGIGGDRTQHLLWRLQDGEVKGIHPKAAVVLIGTNNIVSRGGNTVDEVVAGITAVIAEVRKQLPDTKVLVLAILPRGATTSDYARAKLAAVNEKTAALADGKNVFYADIGRSLLQPDGSLSPEIMPDYLHPSHKGYEIMFTALKPQIDQMLK